VSVFVIPFSHRLRRTAVQLAIASAGAFPLLAAATSWHPATPPLSTPWTAEVSPTNALPEYPRPQLARPDASHPLWTNLNGVWEFEAAQGAARPAFGKALKSSVLVPYPVESALSGVQKHSDDMLYRRTFSVPKNYLSDQQHVLLHFGAVNYAATVYVNGQQVADHKGGYDAFSADITKALRSGDKQELIVAVHAPIDSLDVPVGKQRRKPYEIFYTSASGIWQTVWMEPVPAAHIASLTATPDVAGSAFVVNATIQGNASPATLSVDAYAGSTRVAHADGPANSSLTLKIDQPRLWSPADPFLYTFKATLHDGSASDTVESYAGLRSIAVQMVNGTPRITLNGKPTFLLATLDQGYWPDGIYTAPTDAALKFDIEKTRDLGFNTIRKHIKVEPARWYYWADKLGMLVWQDIPSLAYRGKDVTTQDQANFRRETSSIVQQLKGVTSIIGWIPFNEGWGQWSLAAPTELGRLISEIDSTRLLDERSGANCCDIPGDPGTGNIIDWHDYAGPPYPAPKGTRAAIDGEHGGYTLTVKGHLWPSAKFNPYSGVQSSEELNQKYIANTRQLIPEGVDKGLSGSVYTQITDVEGEKNGLFTYDRKVEKVDEARVRAVNQSVIAAGARGTVDH